MSATVSTLTLAHRDDGTWQLDAGGRASATSTDTETLKRQ